MGDTDLAKDTKEPQTQAQCQPRPAEVKIVAGQAAIIRNSPNARLNGQRVICEEFNTGLKEWLVKDERLVKGGKGFFPLSVRMSIGEQFLEVVADTPTLLISDGRGGKIQD